MRIYKDRIFSKKKGFILFTPIFFDDIFKMHLPQYNYFEHSDSVLGLKFTFSIISCYFYENRI